MALCTVKIRTADAVCGCFVFSRGVKCALLYIEEKVQFRVLSLRVLVLFLFSEKKRRREESGVQRAGGATESEKSGAKRDVEARRAEYDPTKTLTHGATQREGIGVIGEKISCHLHESNRASTADSMEKKYSFPQKIVSKLVPPSWCKNIIYVQKHGTRSPRRSSKLPSHFPYAEKYRARSIFSSSGLIASGLGARSIFDSCVAEIRSRSTYVGTHKSTR